MSASFVGTIPDTIYENAQRGDWVAYLTFSSDVLSVALIGRDAGLFTATFNSRRIMTITPLQAFDAEAWAVLPEFQLSLSVRTAAGRTALPDVFRIRLVNVDDTPPQDLRFSSGGVVLANDVGAPIGNLVATDPDSAGPLEYRVAWPDSAWFEMVGTELRLRPGVDLTGLGGTQREVLIEVSDGRNLASYGVTITILAPGPASPFQVLDGTLGADTLVGTAAADALLGHDGNDLLAGAAGADSLLGGAGADTVGGGDGADTLRGQDGNDLLEGAAGADSLFGDAGDDWLVGGVGIDRLVGGDGADTLDGGGEGDRLIGGAGDDVYLLRSQSDSWLEVAGGGIDELVVGWSKSMPVEIERLRLRSGAGDISAFGGSGNDSLYGNEGRNTLVGALGNDLLDGGAGADSLVAGDGADSLLGGAGDDRLFGEAGNDTMSAGDGADEAQGGVGADRLDGGAGDDRLTGGDDNDQLLGAAGDDLLAGGAGADTLEGGAGRDRLLGDDGNDLLLGGDDADLLDGGAGADTLDGGAGADQLQGGSGDDLLRAGVGAGDLLRGGAGADTLDGTAGDRLAGRFFGGIGDDLYIIDNRGDLVFEEASGGLDTVWAQLPGGGYVLPANVERLVLLGAALSGFGNGLNNLIIGNSLPNLLLGGGGADTLRGGLGDDTLGGSIGADRYQVDLNAGLDTVLDFTPGQDRLLVPSASYASPAAALAAVQNISTGTFLPLGSGSVILAGLAPWQLSASDFELF
ncbi:calcium-binding protein [Falsiroseomonas sp.]|uniref:calcium-binding protein n=1 Tax=Falsiroseomonas sp. TaxID=2870721 RepID=UPI003F717E6A